MKRDLSSHFVSSDLYGNILSYERDAEDVELLASLKNVAVTNER